MRFDLKKQALIASGLKGENRLAAYAEKLEFLIQKCLPHNYDSFSIKAQAKILFDGLWQHKPGRYRPNGNYRLDEVIDAQLKDGNHAVGNCLGLTVLYNCLLETIGIQAEALHLQNAFGMGPHVLTLLKTGDDPIQIENILPGSFDYKGHLHDPSAKRWGPKELVADIYHSRGNELFKRGQFGRALKNYNMALKLNPQYESARLNKAILKDRMKTAGQNEPTDRK
jgi:tetratricopeptide (TPR) repeat protein